jgi:hypothetical protein
MELHQKCGIDSIVRIVLYWVRAVPRWEGRQDLTQKADSATVALVGQNRSRASQ